MNKLIRENLEFQRGASPAKALDVGSFRNQIDWDNLPKSGFDKVYRVITPDNECIISIASFNFYMVKNWMDENQNEEWAMEWFDKDWIISSNKNLGEWLKQQGAFNLITMYRKASSNIEPGWDSIIII